MNCCGSSSTNNCYLCLEPLTHPIYFQFQPKQCHCRWNTHIQCGIQLLKKSPNCLICRHPITYTDCVIRQPIVNCLFQSIMFISMNFIRFLQYTGLYERMERFYQANQRTMWFSLQLNSLLTMILYCYIMIFYSELLANLFIATVISGLSGLLLIDLLFECSFS